MTNGWPARPGTGVGKTVLLEYLAEQAAECRVVRATGVQSEMELAFALHRRRPKPPSGCQSQRKRTFKLARPKIFRPPDFAATMTAPERVAGSSDLTRPLNSMSAPSVADTIAGADSRTA